jgi:hypothetical protein
LRFFGDHGADPVWDDRGMVDLDSLAVSDEVRAQARAWGTRWDELVTAQLHADWYASGTSHSAAAPVSEEQWDLLERDGRAVCKRLQDELGEEWLVEWDE